MRNIRLRRASTTSPSISIFSSLPVIAPPLSFSSAGDLLGDGRDVGRFGALCALARLVLDTRAFGERLEALADDVRVVHEKILRAFVRGDETVPLAVVEPLDGSAGHKKTPPSPSDERVRKAPRANPDSLWLTPAGYHGAGGIPACFAHAGRNAGELRPRLRGCRRGVRARIRGAGRARGR